MSHRHRAGFNLRVRISRIITGFPDLKRAGFQHPYPLLVFNADPLMRADSLMRTCCSLPMFSRGSCRQPIRFCGNTSTKYGFSCSDLLPSWHCAGARVVHQDIAVAEAQRVKQQVIGELIHC